MRENVEQGCDMDKSTIIAKLREYEEELKAAGVEHLLLHGSYARGTAIREASDVTLSPISIGPESCPSSEGSTSKTASRISSA
jgi:hypothetical protein